VTADDEQHPNRETAQIEGTPKSREPQNRGTADDEHHHHHQPMMNIIIIINR